MLSYSHIVIHTFSTKLRKLTIDLLNLFTFLLLSYLCLRSSFSVTIIAFKPIFSSFSRLYSIISTYWRCSPPCFLLKSSLPMITPINFLLNFLLLLLELIKSHEIGLQTLRTWAIRIANILQRSISHLTRAIPLRGALFPTLWLLISLLPIHAVRNNKYV